MAANGPSLNRTEFLSKFFTGSEAKEKEMVKGELKRARLLRMGNIAPPESEFRRKTEDFRDQHKKLFNRDSH
jgi:hypothetical protein